MSATLARKPLNIILLGDPAAGKATQAAFLSKKYKLYDFDMGHELSVRRAKDKKLDTLLKRNTDQGKLTPTTVVRQILRSTIANVPLSRGILFDGHPKMLGEAKLVTRLLIQSQRSTPIFIYLSIPVDEIVKRMHTRKGYFKGKFGKRADDSEAALRNRAKYYRKNIVQVIDFFSKKYAFKRVSGLGSRASVRQRLESAVEQLQRP